MPLNIRYKSAWKMTRQIEVIANDLKEQDDIVVLGNYELEDGMAVEVKQP